MRRLFLSLRYLVLLAILFTAFSCEHRKLEDPQNTHYVRVYLDEQIKNVTCGFYDETNEKPVYERPSVMRAILSDPQTGKVISERVLRNHGADERGHYIDGHIVAPAGTYNFMVYELGSAVTLVEEPNNFYQMKAYTKPVSDYFLQYLPTTRTEIDEDNIVNTPDHLFHDVSYGLVLRGSHQIDTLKNESGDYFTAKSLALSYYIQVKIKGIEWVTSAVTLINGVAGSTYMRKSGEMVTSDPVHIFFGMNYKDKKRSTSDDAMLATLYSTFNTFGKIDGIPTICTLSFEFIKSDGFTQVEKIDITDLFDTPLVKEKQWILLEHEIVITPPEGAGSEGGMRPGVEEWTDVEAEIVM